MKQKETQVEGYRIGSEGVIIENVSHYLQLRAQRILAQPLGTLKANKPSSKIYPPRCGPFLLNPALAQAAQKLKLITLKSKCSREECQNQDELDFKSQVVQTLYERGYVIGSGAIFGADFAVYQGDPSLLHASHLVFCKYGDGKLRFDQILSIQRVTRSCRKKFLIPLRNEKRGLTFIEMDWSKTQRSGPTSQNKR